MSDSTPTGAPAPTMAQASRDHPIAPSAPPTSFKSPLALMSTHTRRASASDSSPIALDTPSLDVDQDQSFMRLSATSDAFSEGADSTWSFRDSRLTHSSDPASEVPPVHEAARASVDTFGAKQGRAGRQPTGGSSSAKSRPISMSSVSGSLYRSALAELGKYDDATPKPSPTRRHTPSRPDHLPRKSSPTVPDPGRAAGHPLTTPPHHRHRPTASVPLAEIPSNAVASPTLQRADVYQVRGRTRSRSIDSLSINPSLTDSVTGLLLPPGHASPAGIPPVHPYGLPADLVAKNNLNSEQRAVLLRRARKLEQMLGQSLDERSIERLLIDPIHAPRTITTHAAEEVWPSSPSGNEQRAEWQQDDCVPRRGKQADMPGLARSGSVLAKRARAALGMDTKSKAGPKTDLAVYVSREMRVSETSVPGVKPIRNSLSSPVVSTLRQYPSIQSPTSPRSIMDDVSEDEMDEDEMLRKTRRMQLAKLHRLLGVHIPLDLVLRQGQDLANATPAQVADVADNSFMSLDDKPGFGSPGWASKLKSTLNSVKSTKTGSRSQTPTPSSTKDDSYVDMGDTMTGKEKAVARKKAQKLEYMFGDAPPQSLFISPRPATPPPDRDDDLFDATSPPTHQQSVHDSYEAYERSLTGLLYLADHDQSSLDHLMDQLDIFPGAPLTRSQSGTPARSPTASIFPQANPDSFDARRKRTGKLSHFFGETGIDFSDPPTVEDTMDKVRAQKRMSMRRETLDSMMREMWRGVQGEVKRGSMAVTEGEKLGEMIERLRRRRSIGQWEVL